MGVIIPPMIRDSDKLTSVTCSQSRIKGAKRDSQQICRNRGTHGVSLHCYSISAKSQSIRLVKQEAPASLGGGGRHRNTKSNWALKKRITEGKNIMKKIFALFLCFCLSILTVGCYETYQLNDSEQNSLIVFSPSETESELLSESESESYSESETDSEPETETQNFEISEDETLPVSVEKDGSYTSPEDVAEYIHTFGTLPDNFITKKEAQKLGWNSSEGNLWEVAQGKSIGGDVFGNREGLLPEGSYHECDVNYQGGYRGAERLIYSDSGEIYYTDDHYKTFTQLY